MLEFSSGSTKMDEAAFYGCVLLTQITIPESVAVVGDYAFSRCTYLVKVVFVGDLPSIGGNSFRSVTADCYYPADNETWTKESRTNYGGELNWQKYSSEAEKNADVNLENTAS